MYANMAFCRMSGYDRPAEVIGRDLLEFVAPESREKVAGYTRARNRGQPTDAHYDSIGLRKDGSRFPYEITVDVIGLSDGPVTMAFITDISERKAATDALAKSGASLKRAELIAGIGHWEFHMDSNIVRASDGTRSIYGLSGEQWSIPEVQQIPLPEYRPMLDEALKALIRGSRPYDVEFRIRRQSDNAIVDIHSIAEYDPREKIVFGVIRDVTETRRAAVSLEQARKKMSLLNTVTFQDIQSAAFSLTAYHILIRQLHPDARISSFLDKETVLIQKITGSLNFAKNYQDMGMQPPRWQNVGQTFLFAISHLDFLSIAHTLDTGTLEVFADPLLEKVFFNLMENVLRHGPGTSAVRLSYREHPDGLVLFVEDNGPGIPQEEKHMIFDRGYGKDTGLGLFLVREILSITGMTIRESGTAGQGARFEIHVPREAYRIGSCDPFR